MNTTELFAASVRLATDTIVLVACIFGENGEFQDFLPIFCGDKKRLKEMTEFFSPHLKERFPTCEITYLQFHVIKGGMIDPQATSVDANGKT